jgi:hypothetical protein
MTRHFYWYQSFWPCDLDLEVWPTFQKTIPLAISLEWQVIGISYVCSLWQYLSFWPCDFHLEVWPTFQKFNIRHIFWMVSDRAFMIHMCVPYDKTLLLVPKCLTLWHWPWSLTHFKNFYIGHIFWISDKDFICVFLVTIPSAVLRTLIKIGRAVGKNTSVHFMSYDVTM